MPQDFPSDDPSCPFCAIANGRDKDAEIICSGPGWIAFFPDSPATPGHTLVIPRKHVRDLWVADEALGVELFRAVSRIGRAIQQAVEPEGINLISSAGSAAEQTVFHLHLHLVPRWENDRLDIWPPKRPLAQHLKQGIAATVRQACHEESPPSASQAGTDR